MQIEWGKLLTLLVTLACATTLGVVDKIPSAAVVGLFTAVLGYTFGNGRQAIKGQEPVPLFKPGPALRGERRATDAVNATQHVADDLAAELGRPPTVDELIAAMGAAR